MQKKSAHLEVIFNGMLAQIVFSNGQKSRPFITKHQALEKGELLIGEQISAKEWAAIEQQIEDSPLFTRNQGLEDYCDHKQDNIASLEHTLKQFIEQEEREGEKWKES